MDKHTKELLWAARDQGWRVADNGRGPHIKLFPPDGGRPLALQRSKPSHRGRLNARAQARRAGLEL
jgi:hypothetical protein